MRDEFEEYCERLDLNQTLSDRVEEIYDFYVDLCPEELQHILITQTLSDDEDIAIDSLWFFSDNYVMEASDFRKDDNFDMLNIDSGFKYIQINKADYDFHDAGPTSVLHVYVQVTDSSMSLNMALSTVGDNCDALADLVVDYIRPRLG